MKKLLIGFFVALLSISLVLGWWYGPARGTAREYAVFVLYVLVIVWYAMLYTAVSLAEDKMNYQLKRLNTLIDEREGGLVCERIWAEMLAYELMQHLLAGRDCDQLFSPHQSSMLTSAMQCLSRKCHEASEKAERTLQEHGRDSDLYQGANESFKIAKGLYWHVAERLLQMSIRPKMRSWKNDLPRDIKEAEEAARRAVTLRSVSLE